MEIKRIIVFLFFIRETQISRVERIEVMSTKRYPDSKVDWDNKLEYYGACIEKKILLRI